MRIKKPLSRELCLDAFGNLINAGDKVLILSGIYRGSFAWVVKTSNRYPIVKVGGFYYKQYYRVFSIVELRVLNRRDLIIRALPNNVAIAISTLIMHSHEKQ